MASPAKHLVDDPGAGLKWIAADPRAACTGTDPRGLKFYPPSWPADLAQPALNVCFACPLQQLCRDEVLDIPEAFDPGGIWGGTRPSDRKRMRRERKAA